MAATTVNQIAQGTNTTLLSTELNSLANNTFSSASSALNNVFATSNLNGYLQADIELVLAAYTGTPTAGSSINGWFILSIDGTNYETATSAIARAPDFIIPVDATASGPLRRTIQRVPIPVGNFKVMASNNGLGLTLAASGNTIIMRPSSVQAQ